MFGEPVDAVQFLRDTDILRAMRHALVTADTVAGLAEFGDAAVVAHQKRPARPAVIFVLRRGGDIPFVDTRFNIYI